jgi:hypothetical protein
MFGGKLAFSCIAHLANTLKDILVGPDNSSLLQKIQMTTQQSTVQTLCWCRIACISQSWPDCPGAGKQVLMCGGLHSLVSMGEYVHNEIKFHPLQNGLAIYQTPANMGDV